LAAKPQLMALVSCHPESAAAIGRRFAPLGRSGRIRGHVERSLSWLSCPLQVRRDPGRWFAFVLVACAAVCFNRLYRSEGVT
jgi:hypothetical protein